MAGFLSGLKKLLGTPRVPAAFVAAFGKHPGWNDHMDDLGMESQQLIDLRRILYVQGISGNVDSGAWEKLAPEQQLEDYHHLFLWRSGESIAVGRMWSSSDGKGRRKYPMIVVAQFDNVPASFAIERSIPLLDRLEREVRAATDAATVTAALDRARSEMRQALPPEPFTGDPGPNPLALLSRRQEMGPENKGLRILLYHLEREMAAFHRGVKSQPAASRQMRVPACADSPAGALSLWTRFLVAHMDPAAMLTVIAPLEQPWVDLIVGEPAPAQFFCIRATPRVAPMATDIPYNLDESFVSRANQMIAQATA